MWSTLSETKYSDDEVEAEPRGWRHLRTVACGGGLFPNESSLCQGDIVVGLRARVIEPPLGRRLLRSVGVGPGVTSPKSRP